MKKIFLKGVIIYFILSLMLNLLMMLLFDRRAEILAIDRFHLIPTLMLNELLEAIIAPSFPDILFLFPIALN